MDLPQLQDLAALSRIQLVAGDLQLWLLPR
jgi:hypothetical protein